MIVARSAGSNEPTGNYEVKWMDYEPPMRQIWIDVSVFNNKDVGFLKDLLLRQSPEFRAFILESAQMICEAGE